mgnify:CR=1 FL=1
MSQEDDLRGLAKVMDFMRALSVLFVVVNIYWFCYPSIREWNVNIGVVDRILLNFQRTTGLFRLHPLDKAFLRYLPCPLVSGHEGCKGGKNQMGAYLDSPLRRCRPLLFQLVAALPARTVIGTHRLLYIHSLPSATSACSLPVYGSPACSNRISWTMCSTTRTKVSCRKQGLSKMNIP